MSTAVSASVPSSGIANASSGFVSESQRRIDALSAALANMQNTTADASRCCEQITRRAGHLESLTSPASDASATLTRAGTNLTATLTLLKDAREKFDTITDCEPSIERLRSGVRELEEFRKSSEGRRPRPKDGAKTDKGNPALSEQDIYGAADSMEIIRDAYNFFLERRSWRSTPSAIGGLERVHKMGVQAMCLLVHSHLKDAGQAVRLKRVVKKSNGSGKTIASRNETADETRERLSAALQNRDLLQCIGEYEESQPVEARSVRELRSVFECLNGDNWHLGEPRITETEILLNALNVPANKVVRTEKVGSGCFSKLVKDKLKSGYPHLDAYGEVRKKVAFASIDTYYRHSKAERKKRMAKASSKGTEGDEDEADAAARDAVRCLEHAMVVVAGEKSVYRTVVGPSMSGADEDGEVSPLYRRACVAAYSHVAGAVVDRTLDVIETVFLKEGGIGQSSGSSGEATNPGLTVRSAASGAAAGLRMLDGVRMLGPSLAKLCDVQVVGKKTPASQDTSVASTLCIAIHRTTVKNTARTLENLAKAIQEDPLDGAKYRPTDARVAPVSSDAVRAIRLISSFISAYKSVTKRRALPWDPNIGEEAGELDSFVRFLVMRLLNSLQGKALNYTRDPGDDAQAKSNIFMINNTYFLLNQLGPDELASSRKKEEEEYRIESSWFTDKVNKIYDSEKRKYLAHWEELNKHLTAVDSNELQYQKDKVLSLESGRLIKSRFTGFNEDFEKKLELHKHFSIIDGTLRDTLIKDVKGVFLSRYKRFYDKFSRIQFSKKNMEQYLKFPPKKVDAMLNTLFVGSTQ